MEHIHSESDSNPGTPYGAPGHSAFHPDTASTVSVYGNSEHALGSVAWQNDQIHYICTSYHQLQVQLRSVTAFDNRWATRVNSDARQQGIAVTNHGTQLSQLEQFRVHTTAQMEQCDKTFTAHLTAYKAYQDQIVRNFHAQSQRLGQFDAHVTHTEQ